MSSTLASAISLTPLPNQDLAVPYYEDGGYLSSAFHHLSINVLHTATPSQVTSSVDISRDIVTGAQGDGARGFFPYQDLPQVKAENDAGGGDDTTHLTLSPSPPRKSHSKKKPLGYIPRPRNSFMIFRSEYLRRQREKGRNTAQNRISEEAAPAWRSLSPEVKQRFILASKLESQWHKEKYPGYVYSPKKDKSGSKTKTSRARGKKARCAPSTDTSPRTSSEDFSAASSPASFSQPTPENPPSSPSMLEASLSRLSLQDDTASTPLFIYPQLTMSSNCSEGFSGPLLNINDPFDQAHDAGQYVFQNIQSVDMFLPSFVDNSGDNLTPNLHAMDEQFTFSSTSTGSFYGENAGGDYNSGYKFDQYLSTADYYQGSCNQTPFDDSEYFNYASYDAEPLTAA